MAELIHIESGTVRWRGDDPLACLAAQIELGDEAPDHAVVGFDSSDFPEVDLGDAEEVAKLPKVKLISEKATRSTLLVNEATGEFEQALPATGKIEIADPNGGDGTIEVTPAQLRDLSIERAIDHMAATHERAIGASDELPADQTQAAVAEVFREAAEAGEALSPGDALARAQERIEGGATGTPAEAPGEIRHAGEPVAFRIEKA